MDPGMSPNHSTTDSVELTGLLTDWSYVLVVQVTSSIGVLLTVLGMVTNVINILTFIRMGPGDGVTVSFLGLSATDFLMSVFGFVNCVSLFFEMEEARQGVDLFPWFDPYVFFVFFSNIFNMFSTVNALTTLYLALARCMCVARPLHFKHAFTTKRSVAIIGFFYAFVISTYSPLLVHMGFVEKFSAALNQTRYVLWLSDKREAVKDDVYLIVNTIVPFSTQVIVIVCILIMTWTLVKATKFRTQCQGQDVDVPQGSSGESGKLAGKDLQAVQQVVLISSIFIVCNTPVIIIS